MYIYIYIWASSSAGKESACNATDLGLIPGLGGSPGGGHGSPLQYSCLENPMGRGAWGATVHGVTKSRTQLSDSAQHIHVYKNIKCIYRASLVAQLVKNPPAMQETLV